MFKSSAQYRLRRIGASTPMKVEAFFMNIGEMQRKLSVWAEQDKERKFYDLYGLLCNMDWLRLAQERVAQNAGSKTAGCDGINMSAFGEVGHV